MQKSKYNYIYKRSDDEFIVYNTYSKALLTLDKNEYEDYISDNYSDEMMKCFAENGILVEDSFDELHFLKYMHYQAKFSKHNLNLTIAPTMDCNFDCPYCYENRRPGKMSENVQNALIDYIRERIDEGTKNIDISWYGGEPLLYFEIVYSLAKRIRTLVDSKNVNLKMFMVTNGYLLTKDIVEKLDEIGITRVQITLDGIAEHHDKSRPLRGGRGSFERIWNNLSLFDDSPIEVVIRMNVDNNNSEDYSVLKSKIKEFDNSNISIYPSPVEDINKDKVNVVSDFMTSYEFDDFTINECNKNNPLERKVDFGIVDDRCCYCAAELQNSYVIDEIGDFYKCWDEIGRIENRCFNILNKEDINYDVLSRYLVKDVFEDSECCNCVFLPLCFGGCIFQKTKLNKKTCGFSAQIIENYIEQEFFKERR